MIFDSLISALISRLGAIGIGKFVLGSEVDSGVGSTAVRSFCDFSNTCGSEDSLGRSILLVVLE
jgi:hypothetical protein